MASQQICAVHRAANKASDVLCSYKAAVKRLMCFVDSEQQASSKGAFVRKVSGHRNWIRADGSSEYKAEAGRYHLYVANNCPWCHRQILHGLYMVLYSIPCIVCAVESSH